MRTLLLSGYGLKLTTSGRTFRISSKDEKRYVSPADVDQILVSTSGVSISSSAVRLAMDYGIEIVFLDGRGDWARLFLSSPVMTVETRKAQYSAILRGDKVGEEIVRSKVENQGGHLKYWGRQYGKLDDVRGLPEPQAARLYWSSLGSLLPKELGFKGRDHDSPDQVNSSLNYMYALLYSACHRELSLVGLDPYAGFVHKDRSGKESLVYDFSEMFKPSAVDFPLWRALLQGERFVVSQGLLDRESRRKLIALFNSAMEDRVRDLTDSQTRTLRQHIRAYALKLGSYLRGERGFRGFVQSW